MKRPLFRLPSPALPLAGFANWWPLLSLLLAGLAVLVPLPLSPFASIGLLPVCWLVLFYWALHRPDRVSYGSALLLGLLLDSWLPTPFGLQLAQALLVVGVAQLWRQWVRLHRFVWLWLAALTVLLVQTLLQLVVLGPPHWGHWAIEQTLALLLFPLLVPLLALASPREA